jgi:cytochrome P450
MFALYELAMNRDIQNRLRKEIKDVTASHDGKITYDSINEMKFLDMVFNETLRKFPVVDVQLRRCTSTFKIPQTEMIIPKDVSIMISSYAFHRDERFFEKSDEFDPERFNEENVKKIRPFTFIPFSEFNQAMI